MKIKFVPIVILALLLAPSVRAVSDAEAATIADDLVSKMTLAEKVAMVHGDRIYSCPGVPRLGIPPLLIADGPCSVRPELSDGGDYLNPGKTDDCATALPPLSAVAATWDPAMARLFGETLSSEVRARGKDMSLGPSINIMRTPVGGRTFEYMGEDPYLTAHMCVPVIEGVQSNDVTACVKHFAMNNQELDRGTVNVEVDERTMREIYLPGFEAAVTKGGVLSIMGAYNRVDDLWCCENPYLLLGILRGEWGFKGLVISDWGAVHDAQRAALAGCQQDSGLGDQFPRLGGLVDNGDVPVAVLDAMVRQRLILYVKLRMIGPETAMRAKGEINTPAHFEAARKIASEAIVLLKNDGHILPLDPGKLKTVLVVGSNAVAKLCIDRDTSGGCKLDLGGGSGEAKPPYEVTALDGLRNRLGQGVKIDYVPLDSGTFTDIPSSCLKAIDPTGKNNSWDATFFNNQNLEGDPLLKRQDSTLSFDWKGQSPAPGVVPPQNFSARWKAKVVAPETGNYKFEMANDDGARFFVDGKPVITTWRIGPAIPAYGEIQLEAGKEYVFTVEYFQASGPSSVFLRWQLPSSPDRPDSPAFVRRVREADAVLLFTGDTHAQEQEGKDRPNIKLPAGQDAVVNALVALNPKTIVINQSGAPVEMPWADKAKAIVQYWFCGQEGGNALARILCGDVNPSGRLPCTFPNKLEDVPSMKHYAPGQVTYAEGVFVGYRWFDTKNIQPLFPFGHGLSYTTFKYGPPTLSSKSLASGQTLTVQVPVTNTGKRAGAEVVQLYVHDSAPLIERPVQELKGFARIELAPGETKTVTFTLTPRDFAYWSIENHGWKTNSGEYEVRVGASSRDIRGSGMVSISM